MGAKRAVRIGAAAIVVLLVGLDGSGAAVKKIGTKGIRNRAITTGKLAGAAVTTAKLADGAVTGTKLADGAVMGQKLADGAVTGTKLADGAVTGQKVVNGSLAPADLAETVSDLTVDPPGLAAGACASIDAGISGLSGGDAVLVIPGSYDDGWPVDFTLEGYGPTGPAGVKVRLCNRSLLSADEAGVPLRAFVFDAS